MLFSNLQRNGLRLAEKKYYKTPKNTIIELRSSLMNLFFETDTIPSAAPAFAKLPSLAIYIKIAAPLLAILKPLTPVRIVLRFQIYYG